MGAIPARIPRVGILAMHIRARAVLAAVSATVLVGSVAGTLSFLGDYYLLLLVERGLEALGLVPRGWGAAHAALPALAAGILTVVVVVLLCAWVFRRVYDGEIQLTRRGHPGGSTGELGQ
ncbi:MAG TPA: hypothetical protein VGC25_04385 [Alphaproteobacteria bacterium]|jgi:hypothetical protein